MSRIACFPPPPPPRRPVYSTDIIVGFLRVTQIVVIFFLYLPVSDRSWECGRKDAASFRVLLCESVRHNCRSKK